MPLPGAFIQKLERIHAVRALKSRHSADQLWNFSRSTGWRRMQQVMKAAKVAGIRASSRGLRHSYGVHAIMTKIPETKVQKYMGHASKSTTAIYMDAIGPEDREIARRMWKVGA